MENKQKKSFKWNWGSAKFNAIIAIIGCVGTIIGTGISICTLNEAKQIVGSINADSINSMQNADVINNNGLSLEDVDYNAKNTYKEMMNDAYQAEDIIRFVNENPNLSFCLLWHGTEEEYQNTNWDEMPPNIKIERYDAHGVTFSYN